MSADQMTSRVFDKHDQIFWTFTRQHKLSVRKPLTSLKCHTLFMGAVTRQCFRVLNITVMINGDKAS